LYASKTTTATLKTIQVQEYGDACKTTLEHIEVTEVRKREKLSGDTP